MSIPRFALLMALAASFLPTAARSEVRLKPIFSDHMMIDSRRPIVLGTAEPNEKVSVALAGKVSETTADAKGAWSADLGALKPGGPHDLVITGTANTVKISDVFIGEVWVFAGGSLLDYRLGSIPPDRGDHYELPGIRMFRVKKSESSGQLEGEWIVCTPATAPRFSAVAFAFACGRADVRKSPVSTIVCSAAGAPIENWLLGEATPTSPDTDPSTRPPTLGSKLAPGTAWVESVLPLAALGVSGVIWVHGDANAARPLAYGSLLERFIKDWRTEAKQPELPFLVLQAPGFLKKKEYPTDSRWAELRQAQWAAGMVKGVRVVSVADLSTEKGLSEQGRATAGERLALAISGSNSGVSPEFASMKIQKGSAKISFKNTGGTLTDRNGGKLEGFAIAGADQTFRWADAKLSGTQVTVSHRDVPVPVAVRYAWADQPDAELLGKNGLPVIPFRTDQWERSRSIVPPSTATPTPSPLPTPAANATPESTPSPEPSSSPSESASPTASPASQ